MAKRKRLKLKEPFISIVRICGIILAIILAVFLFYRYEIHTIKKLGYSEKASQFILFNFKKSYVKSVHYSDTLNAAFESESYNEKYLKYYAQIDYYKGDLLISDINSLLDKKYSVSEINVILAHGSLEDVRDFAKKDKVVYLDEYFEYSFARIRLYDRYLAYSDETGENAYNTIVYVNLDIDKEEYKEPYLITKFSIDMLVNKHFSLTKSFVPNNLVTISSDDSMNEEIKLNGEAYKAFKQMKADMNKEGLDIYINEGYRSYSEQEELCDYYRNLYGDNYVSKYVALPGFSEHQTGLAIDVSSTSVKTFANSKEFRWMIDNSYKYGFILRYDSMFIEETQYNSEPWHYRYVGTEISNYIHEHYMSYEEYYAVNLFK